MEQIFDKETKEQELQRGLEEFKKADQQKLFNRKQTIMVNGKEYEFSQFDGVFSISRSQIP